MAELKYSDWHTLNELLRMEEGYVLNFTNWDFQEFFRDEFAIEIYSEDYAGEGTSKAKRLRFFIKRERGQFVARVLRALWEHRINSEGLDPKAEASNERRYMALVAAIEDRDQSKSRIDGAIEKFDQDATLDKLVDSISRDIEANKPEVALDRLHTYCMKKFAHLLKKRGEEPGTRKEPLNARAGRYLNPMRRSGVRPITDKIMRTTVEIFEEFNGVRNDESLAHDNVLIEPAEARYIFDSVVTLLRFIKATEPSDFGQ